MGPTVAATTTALAESSDGDHSAKKKGIRRLLTPAIFAGGDHKNKQAAAAASSAAVPAVDVGSAAAVFNHQHRSPSNNRPPNTNNNKTIIETAFVNNNANGNSTGNVAYRLQQQQQQLQRFRYAQGADRQAVDVTDFRSRSVSPGSFDRDVNANYGSVERRTDSPCSLLSSSSTSSLLPSPSGRRSAPIIPYSQYYNNRNGGGGGGQQQQRMLLMPVGAQVKITAPPSSNTAVYAAAVRQHRLQQQQQQQQQQQRQQQQAIYGNVVASATGPFVRGSPHRATIGCVRESPGRQSTIYETEEDVVAAAAVGEKRFQPIFKRGALQEPAADPSATAAGQTSPPPPSSGCSPKRVSFSPGPSEPPAYWPTKKGPSPQPPTRQRSTDSPVAAAERPLPLVPKRSPSTSAIYGTLQQRGGQQLPHQQQQQQQQQQPSTPIRWWPPPSPSPLHQHYQQSGSESGSEAGEVQRILNAKNGHRLVIVLKMNSRSRKIVKAALQQPTLTTNVNVHNEIVQYPLNNNNNVSIPDFEPDLEYTTLTTVPLVEIGLNNIIFNEIMEQKSGPILSDSLSTSIESRSTTEWLPRNLNYESDTSSSSKTQNPVNFDVDNVVVDPVSTENSMDFIPLSIENQNTPNTVEEVLVVGMEGVRPKRKINIREITKLEKSKGVGKKLQPNPCANKKCQNKCSEKFSENERQIIFSEFWKLADPIRQKDYILNCVKEMPIKRKRVIESSKRNVTKEYSLPFEIYRKKVCLQYVLSTLNITKKFLNYTIDNALSPTTSKIDQRGRHSPKHKKSYDIMKSIDDFIQKLPAVKSHYCRASSNKKYLPAEMGNLSRLYQVYKSHCAQNKIEIVKNSLFRKIFKKKYNIGFHYPKKDKCRFCSKYENIESTRELTEDECKFKKNHEEEKNEVKDMFLFEQELSRANGNFICVSFDLQKVLSTPQGQNMNLYYSRKYSTFNLTIYESGSQNALAYLWGETTGARGCNEIVTCVYKYLLDLDEKHIYKSVSFFCDSCSGQNKNRAMLAMIHSTHFEYIEEVKITFLLPGHTYMPVDSIHATIERFVKNKTIWAPSEWSTLITNARIKPLPIVVKNLQYSDFIDWKKLASQFFTQVLKTTDEEVVHITKVKSFLFIKPLDGLHKIHVFFTYKSEENPKILKLKKNKKNIVELSQCYETSLNISNEKRVDLVKLCNEGIIPQKYHDEYLQMQSDLTINDALPETDDEDVRSSISESD